MFKKLLPLGLILVLCLFLASCAANHKKHPAQPPVQTEVPAYVAKTVYPVLEVPAWLCNLPEGENSIGLAWNNKRDMPDPDDAAREFAAVSISRNHASFIVDKSAVIKYAEQTELTSDGREFNVVVSADTSYLYWADRSLKSQASFFFNGYKACLFSAEPRQVDATPMQVSYSNLPDWTSHRDVYVENGYLCIPGYAMEANLIEAWKTAQENALRRLAQYRLINVIGTLRSTEDWTKKMLILETVIKSPNATLSKSWFYQKKIDNLSSYGVFILLKVQK